MLSWKGHPEHTNVPIRAAQIHEGRQLICMFGSTESSY